MALKKSELYTFLWQSRDELEAKVNCHLERMGFTV